MKQFKALSVGSAFVVALVAATSTFAVTITPPGPSGQAMPFAAYGATTLSKSGNSISCNTVLVGTIDGIGGIRITAASFTGNSLCSTVKANASLTTPWTGTVATPAQLVIDNVAVNVEIPMIGGKCGPTQVQAGINDKVNTKETMLSFSNVVLSGGCQIAGSLVTTPYLHITN